ncbi:polyamine ABC transporter substrate-binding protein [Bailinhaonella thermotolerans]|uniref:Spermidine/putrescine ABC transporter substrate-binding protein n=1 Tax=Bailinhaonella thermotolerans TaxID=1070861 RepID=A0A3A4A2F4_9ACTN|nr:spermidine/putrescine ABC transporter substrate-binding protein [Bailinhaonella thermotolerans]RJL21738.1 spermidine/putrescine ABC transporter substrate-binding protein [Bailinhaonella thermotolerans]
MDATSPDPALLRGLTRPRRRDVFRLTGLAAAGLALSACGVEGKKAPPAGKSEVERFWAGKVKNGRLDFANWAYYMEAEGKSYPLLDRFAKESGITVTYKEVIEDNPSFFGKVEPQLRSGQSIGYDIIVITNGVEFGKLKALGYLTPLDHSKLPNFLKNAGPQYQRRSYDEGNVYSVPYTSGVTGIAYNTKYVDWEITKIADLWDPRLKGKVGMMSDPQELGNFGMFLGGVDPERSTPADWKKAGERLQEQRDKGVVRKYYEQDYITAVAKGEVWACMAWSGDAFQEVLKGNKDLRFVVPAEGATIWTDNMLIPKGAANPVDAITFMDWLYQPQNAAELLEYIQYIAPWDGLKDVVKAHAAEAKGEEKAHLEKMVQSPLVFPTAEDLARFRGYRNLTPAEEKEFRSVFVPVVEG